jgi:hypothetical protein
MRKHHYFCQGMLIAPPVPFHLFLLACFRVDAYSSVWDSWVQRYFLELTFGFYGFLTLCWSFCFVLIGEGSVLL